MLLSHGSTDFEILKDFVENVIIKFEIGANKTHVKVIWFGHLASIVISLGSIANVA